jgi:peptide/nickel transport system ATP-binding protein
VTNTDNVLEVQDLTMHYMTRKGPVYAVDGVTFHVGRGEAIGLVGESGCGKTSIAISLLKLLPDNAVIHKGEIRLNGTDIVPLTNKEMNAHRWKSISMVFQAAMNSMNPVYTIEEQILEAMRQHTPHLTDKEMDEKIDFLFDLVGLDPGFKDQYPHQYSGGMRQRAVIAMALSCDPDIIIADEPTTALDVIVQDQILQEIKSLQKEFQISIIFISHDISVVADVSHEIGIMYAGKLVEYGYREEVFESPRHPYTKALLSSYPTLNGEKNRLTPIPGETPNLINPPAGCRFFDRCCCKKTTSSGNGVRSPPLSAGSFLEIGPWQDSHTPSIREP